MPDASRCAEDLLWRPMRDLVLGHGAGEAVPAVTCIVHERRSCRRRRITAPGSVPRRLSNSSTQTPCLSPPAPGGSTSPRRGSSLFDSVPKICRTEDSLEVDWMLLGASETTKKRNLYPSIPLARNAVKRDVLCADYPSVLPASQVSRPTPRNSGRGGSVGELRRRGRGFVRASPPLSSNAVARDFRS